MKIKSAIRKFFRFPFHPLLFAIFPVISLYAYNIFELLPAVLAQPLTYAVSAVLGVFLLVSLVFRNFRKGAILTSLFTVWFFSHGHLHNFLEELVGRRWWSVLGVELGIDDGLFLFWGLALSAAAVLLFITKRDLIRATGFLNVVSLVLVVPVLALIAWDEVSVREGIVKQQDGNQLSQSIEQGADKPDIYYLIFDRYAGQEVLSNYYGFDNEPFSNYLREKGFYVADRSYANYPMTLLSLTSSLNMDYLQALFEELPDSSGEGPAYPLLENSAVLGFLKSAGYKYYHIGSWYYPTRINPNADKNLNFLTLIDGFTFELYQTTLLPPILSQFQQSDLFTFVGIKDIKSLPANLSDLHYKSANYQVNVLKIIGSEPGPKFVFAHILLPHAPIVFGPDCERLSEGEAGIAIESYTNQLTCTNKFIREIVEAVLSRSKDSVIILQADEGANPAMRFPYEKSRVNYGYGFEGAPAETLKERFNILTAIYLGGADSTALYPSISPVNVFRVVLNPVFGVDLPLLRDRHFTSWDHLWDFHGVTKILRK